MYYRAIYEGKEGKECRKGLSIQGRKEMNVGKGYILKKGGKGM